MQAQGLYLAKYTNRFFILFAVLLLLTPKTYGQRIENLYLEQFGDKIIIHYDFVSKNVSDSYQLKVYQSVDGFTKAINLVKGDVGDRVSPGEGKRIEWYAREELGTYKGALIVEVRIFESPENIYIQYPSQSVKLKRGSALNLSWSGGINEDKVSIQLFDDGTQVETIANKIDNNGQFSWVSSKKMKTGKNYSVRISGTSSKGVQSTSGEFVIKRKVPIWLIIAPVVIVGGVVGMLVSKPTNGGDNNLPGAPDPN